MALSQTAPSAKRTCAAPGGNSSSSKDADRAGFARQLFTAAWCRAEVPLPCEERIYQEGLTPPFPANHRPVRRARSCRRRHRLLSIPTDRGRAHPGRVVALATWVQGQQEQVEIVDARIASWFHHLPESKAETAAVPTHH